MFVSAATRARPSLIASDGSAGVEGTLKRSSCPLFVKMKSVNVPPVSMPTRMQFRCLFLSASVLVDLRFVLPTSQFHAKAQSRKGKPLRPFAPLRLCVKPVLKNTAQSPASLRYFSGPPSPNIYCYSILLQRPTPIEPDTRLRTSRRRSLISSLCATRRLSRTRRR